MIDQTLKVLTLLVVLIQSNTVAKDINLNGRFITMLDTLSITSYEAAQQGAQYV